VGEEFVGVEEFVGDVHGGGVEFLVFALRLLSFGDTGPHISTQKLQFIA
jgi:hypothetical protein